MMQNKQILFNKIPEGMPQEDTFKIEDIDTPKLESDGVLCTNAVHFSGSIYERTYD